MLSITISDARQVAPYVWEARVSPNYVASLGQSTAEFGSISLAIVPNATYHPDSAELVIPGPITSYLKIGSSDRLIVVHDIANPKSAKLKSDDFSELQKSQESADKEFLEALKELPDDLEKAGIELLKKIRINRPGKLVKVGKRRFKETPDNFWFAIIQPRDRSIRINVRGEEDALPRTSLIIHADRRPYSWFKICGTNDVEDASRIILNARTKLRRR